MVQVYGTYPQVVDILLATGVPKEAWVLPEEMREPHYGPAISYDDVIDLHEKLKCDPAVIFEELGSA